MKTTDVLIIGGGLALAYYLWKTGKSFSSGIDSLTQSIANEYVDLTSGPSVQSQLQGQVILPNGQTFSTSQLQNYGLVWQGNTLTFTMGNQTYALSQHDANGNYQATPL